jgi:CMP-N-acetylneuraminic acid synthetase
LLKDEPDMFGDDTRVLIIDPKYSVDLDTEEDMIEAEVIISKLQKEDQKL